MAKKAIFKTAAAAIWNFKNFNSSSRDCNRVALSNRAILNDLDGPQNQISRSGHSLTLNISKMAADTAIVTMEGK